MPSYLDLAVLTVVLISGLLALLRGFTREVLAILSWVVAAAAAYYFHPLALPYIKPYIPKENIALAAAAAGVFFATLVVVSLVTVKLSDIILDSKVGALDRTLGFLFGAVRGLLLAVVAFVFYNWLVPEVNQPEWIKTARTKPILQSSGDKLREYLPDDVDSIVAKLKAKKGGPANEEPPVEPSDSEQSKSAPETAPAEATPQKKSERLRPPGVGPHVANAEAA
jgi:membrane protein required for colicin V production